MKQHTFLEDRHSAPCISEYLSVTIPVLFADCFSQAELSLQLNNFFSFTAQMDYSKPAKAKKVLRKNSCLVEN